MLKIKDYNKKYLHKWTTRFYEAMKIHLRHVLDMLYSCTKAIQPLTMQVIKLLMHTGPSPPRPPRLCLHWSANPARLLWAPPRHCHHCAGTACTTQGVLLISAGSGQAGISKMLLGLLRPSCVNGLQHARLSAWRSRVRRSCTGARQLSAFPAAVGWGNIMFMEPKRAGYKALTSNKGGNGRFSTSMHWRARGI